MEARRVWLTLTHRGGRDGSSRCPTSRRERDMAPGRYTSPPQAVCGRPIATAPDFEPWPRRHPLTAVTRPAVHGRRFDGVLTQLQPE